jgi:hypothetical protein
MHTSSSKPNSDSNSVLGRSTANLTYREQIVLKVIIGGEETSLRPATEFGLSERNPETLYRAGSAATRAIGEPDTARSAEPTAGEAADALKEPRGNEFVR